jgi:hypothetical protein
MTGPRVTGDYEYEEGDIHITTDSGQDFDITGDSADIGILTQEDLLGDYTLMQIL